MNEQIKFNNSGSSKPEITYRERKDKVFQVEINFKLADEIMDEIGEVEDACFPEQMRSSREEIREIMESGKAIYLAARDKNNRIFAYLTSVPLTEAYEYLKDYDESIRPEEKTLYLESIAITPKLKPEQVLPNIFKSLIQEALKRGYEKLSMHARINNQFRDKLKKYYQANILRHFDNWHEFDEPFDYLEINFKEKDGR